MLERLTPFFTHVSRALREEPESENTHWDTLLDHPREFAATDEGDISTSDNVTLIVGAPVYFSSTLDETQAKS